METKLFSKYRSALMGLATIQIVIFHGLSVWGYYDVNIPFLLRVVRGFFGSFGVDIFLMMSGIGVFCSLKKDASIVSFYKRRLQRLIPSVVMGCGIFWIIKDIVIEKSDLSNFLFDVMGVSFWINGENRFWYIYLIILLYMITPLFIKLNENQKKIVLLSVVMMPFFLEMIGGQFFINTEIALCRIPIYFFGIILGGGWKPKRTWLLLLLFLLELLRFTGDIVISRYSRSVIAVCICILFCQCCNQIRFKIPIVRWLEIIEKYSLEMYIVQVSLIWFAIHIWKINLTNTILYSLLIVATIIISVVLKFFSDKIVSTFLSK